MAPPNIPPTIGASQARAGALPIPGEQCWARLGAGSTDVLLTRDSDWMD
jgi:hypothetical protein